MGDFEVVKVNGRLQKNGGNVVSYFCTPKGEVVHAVVGPAGAQELLQAARFAVAAYDQARETDPENETDRKSIIERAHLRELGADPNRYRQFVGAALPAAIADFYEQRVERQRSGWSSASYHRTEEPIRPPIVEARRTAARSLGGDRVHQILAAQPLAPLKAVYRELFEELANEEVNPVRGRVFSAARALKDAREEDKPVLFVFYEGEGEVNEADESTRQQVAELLNSRPVKGLLRYFAVVMLPRDELPALSNLVDVPVYEMPSGSSTVFLLAESSGKKRTMFRRFPMPAELAARMLPPVNERRFAQADAFAAEGRHASARRMLRLIVQSRPDAATKERAIQKLAAVAQARRLTETRRASTATATNDDTATQ